MLNKKQCIQYKEYIWLQDDGFTAQGTFDLSVRHNHVTLPLIWNDTIIISSVSAGKRPFLLYRTHDPSWSVSVLALSADGPLRPRNVFSIKFSFSRNYFSLFHTETAGMSEGYNRVQGQRRCLVFIDGGKEFEIGRNMLKKYGGRVCLSSLEMMIIWVWLSSFCVVVKPSLRAWYHNVIDTIGIYFKYFFLNYIHTYFADNNIIQNCDYCNYLQYFFVPSKFK